MIGGWVCVSTGPTREVYLLIYYTVHEDQPRNGADARIPPYVTGVLVYWIIFLQIGYNTSKTIYNMRKKKSMYIEKYLPYIPRFYFSNSPLLQPSVPRGEEIVFLSMCVCISWVKKTS